MQDARQGVLLVDGYIREHLATKSLPLCLSRLCLNFWKPYIHWRVPTRHKPTKKTKTTWISKLYDIDGFRFLLQLHGLSRNLSLNMIQQEIVYEHRKNDIIVYYEIYSPQMGYCCKGSAFKNMCISVWSKSVTLDYDAMNENRHKALDFYVHLDVLKHPSLTVPVKPLRMSKAVRFEWRLNRDLNSMDSVKSSLKSAHSEATTSQIPKLCTLYSPNFDVSGNWCCCFFPRRLPLKEGQEAFQFGLKLLRMDCNIKCIQIDCTVHFDCESISDDDGDGIHIMDQRRIRFTEYENENSYQWMVKDSRISLIQKVRSISVQIVVYKVYVHDLSTPNGRIVSKSNWATYHIV